MKLRCSTNPDWTRTGLPWQQVALRHTAPPAAAQQDAALRAGGSYQSREERNSQVPEVIVQQAAVHHVPKDGDAS